MNYKNDESNNRLGYHGESKTTEDGARSQVDQIVRQEIAQEYTHRGQNVEDSEVDP